MASPPIPCMRAVIERAMPWPPVGMVASNPRQFPD
jgi:hypothetical protein